MPEGPVCLSQKLKPRLAQENLNEIRFNSRLLQAIVSLPPPRKIGLETCSLGQGGEVALSDRRSDRSHRDETRSRRQPTKVLTSSFTPGPMVDAIDTFLM